MKTDDTIVMGKKDGKIIFLKSYDYSIQEKEAQSDLKEVIAAGLEWTIGSIETFEIDTIIK